MIQLMLQNFKIHAILIQNLCLDYSNKKQLTKPLIKKRKYWLSRFSQYLFYFKKKLLLLWDFFSFFDRIKNRILSINCTYTCHNKPCLSFSFPSTATIIRLISFFNSLKLVCIWKIMATLLQLNLVEDKLEHFKLLQQQCLVMYTIFFKVINYKLSKLFY